MRNAGLYIHIPYCVKKCRYCDFISYPLKTGDEITSFLSAALKEAELYRKITDGIQFQSVFFGGGTPSLINGREFFDFFCKLKEILPVSDAAEVTAECNPGTLSEEKLNGYISAGVNRISLGLQSADDTLLKRIGRIHTYADFEKSVSLLKAFEIRNFNVDVMHGLPGQTADSYIDTLKKAVDTGAKHISSYSLILEEGTPLFSDVSEGREKLPEEDLVADMQDAGIEFLERNGFERYEISNFEKDGCRCRHNENYWRNGEYLGIGPAAHSALRLDGWTRWSNTVSVGKYMECITEGTMPQENKEEIPEKEEMFECILLGLRTSDGVSLNGFYDRFGRSAADVYGQAMNKCTENGYINKERMKEGYLALNRKGMDLENLVLQNFMDD